MFDIKINFSLFRLQRFLQNLSDFCPPANIPWFSSNSDALQARGKVNCSTCEGTTHIRSHIQLSVSWRLVTSEHISTKLNIPENLIRNVSGQVAFEEDFPKVVPVIAFKEETIKMASAQLVASHASKFPEEKILRQRHQVRVVPVTKVNYEWKGKTRSFFVYGYENKVHLPDNSYPQSCCWVLGAFYNEGEYRLSIISSCLLLLLRTTKHQILAFHIRILRGMEIPETSLLCLAGSAWWREQRETAQTSHTPLLWTTAAPAAGCLSPRLSCSSSSPRFWLQLNINAIRTLLASGRVFWYISFDYQISVRAGLGWACKQIFY